jgi:hypothetical protein
VNRLDVPAVVTGLERQIAQRPDTGVLGRETVHALDVVYHALVFTKHPAGLRLWREALWNRRIDAEARGAVERMLGHLDAEVAAGNAGAVGAICDCLHTLFEPRAAAVEAPALDRQPPSYGSGTGG